jgi:hypothetical protein
MGSRPRSACASSLFRNQSLISVYQILISKYPFTGPMHAEIHEKKPGCPICGMTLVKKSASPEEAQP